MISQTNIMWLWIGIILFILSVLFNVLLDYGIWKKQINNSTNKRNHAKGSIIKFATSIPAIVVMAAISNFRFVWALSITGVMLFCWFMVCFDGFYNLKRGEPFFFRGTEDAEDDANTDSFWQSIPQWLHISIKLILAFSTAYIYSIGLTK